MSWCLSRKAAREAGGTTSNGKVGTSTSERQYDKIIEPEYGTIVPMKPVNKHEDNNDSYATPTDGVIYSELTASRKWWSTTVQQLLSYNPVLSALFWIMLALILSCSQPFNLRVGRNYTWYFNVWLGLHWVLEIIGTAGNSARRTADIVYLRMRNII